MKKIALLALIAIQLANVSFAQLEELTLEDAVLGRWTMFRAKSVAQLNWVPGEDALVWVTDDTANPAVMKQSIPSGEAIVYFDLNYLKQYDGFAELKKMPRLKWLNSNSIEFTVKGKQSYRVNLKPFEVEATYTIPENANNVDLSSQNDIAFTRGQNLYISKQGEEVQITKDTVDGIVNGQSVHRFEFGIHKGTFWSNNGNHLAFYRKDETMVSNYPLVNYNSKPASSTPVRYPMAGMASHHVTLGIYNLEHGNTVWVKTGEPKEQYLTNVAWGPNDEYIYIALLNRDQNHVKLNQYNARSGEFVKTILEEKHDKYVQPLHPMEFTPNDENQFVWQSEKDGFNHLYLFNLKGKELKQLTQGNWVVTGTQGFDESGNLIFTHTANRGMDRIVSRVNLKSGNLEKLTPVSGVHQVKMSSSGNYLIDRYSSLNKPLVVQVLNTQGKIILAITDAENPLKEYKVSLPELGMIKTHEGDELNTRIFRPFDFDPSKKYKALVYVYNGPGVQLITNSWMAGAPLWMPYMANQGYIVFTVDGRGSENRGREFEQIIFRRLGEMELVDQLSGVEFLRGLDYVNPNKIAVHGWSYGGFMTTSLMLKAPGIFKVGVAGGPVMDWKYYEVMYTERFMDTPETNEAGYARASLLDKVQNLKGDLLIIHGADDDVVVPQHSIDFLKNSVDKGIQVDFFLYPGHKHNVRGKDRVHLMRKVLDYIDEKLED